MVNSMIKALKEEVFETDITLEFTQFTREGDDLHVKCAVFSDLEGELLQGWSITCVDYEEYHFESKESYDLEEFEVRDDHIYLWDYTKPFTELYFKGETKQVKELIAALYLTHAELTERLLPFEKYINFKNGHIRILEELLASKSGLFAYAPEVLNDAYQVVLNEYGFRTTSLAMGSQSTGQVQLLRLRESYIVAKEFIATRAY
ncbi:hypothetical protein QWY14_03165 [Planococcus sp. N028]|uniref:Uncharacterized protein n=1 Tax=Planococcus shixiaomingii TaxID=3058393 RepID=A0ABT8MZK3_9BACL|nr:hypothetical protein [Planococcus sp. N028]MDN7240770.1 hypothetical protein [Planococcus sp. N028]